MGYNNGTALPHETDFDNKKDKQKLKHGGK